MQVTVLRKVGQFELNKGHGMSNGLYNMTNSILLEHTKDEGCSYWFDEDTKNLLMRCSDFEFGQRAKQMAGNNINNYINN